MPMINKYNQAFTLLEMVVVIVILSIIVVGATNFLQTGLTAFTEQQDISDANWQGRLALEEMARSIAEAYTVTTASGTQLAFTDIYGNSNSYQLSGTSLTYNGTPSADGIATVSFTYLDRNAVATTVLANIRYVIITLNITLNGVNYTLRTTVNPRNLT